MAEEQKKKRNLLEQAMYMLNPLNWRSDDGPSVGEALDVPAASSMSSSVREVPARRSAALKAAMPTRARGVAKDKQRAKPPKRRARTNRANAAAQTRAVQRDGVRHGAGRGVAPTRTTTKRTASVKKKMQ